MNSLLNVSELQGCTEITLPTSRHRTIIKKVYRGVPILCTPIAMVVSRMSSIRAFVLVIRLRFFNEHQDRVIPVSFSERNASLATKNPRVRFRIIGQINRRRISRLGR